MRYVLLPLLATAFLAACQGLPFVLTPPGGGPAGSAPPGPTPTPPADACVAPAVVVPASGAPVAVASGYAEAAAGLCVPVRSLVNGPIEVLSEGGGYRLTAELPASLTAAGAPTTLRIGLRYASGAQPAIPDAIMTVERTLAAAGGATIKNAASNPAGAYELAGITWPAAGRWLVTLAFTVGGEPDRARFAVEVLP